MILSHTAESILHAARELFAEKGFSNITTRQIARKAGVNEVTLFRHFGSKAALYEALFEHYGTTSGVYASFERDSRLPPDEALLEFGHSLYKFFCNNELLIRMELREQSFLSGNTIPVPIIANRNKQILADYLLRTYDISEEIAVSFSVTYLSSIWGIYMANHIAMAFSPVPDAHMCVEGIIRSITSHLEAHRIPTESVKAANPLPTPSLTPSSTSIAVTPVIQKPGRKSAMALTTRKTLQAGGTP